MGIKYPVLSAAIGLFALAAAYQVNPVVEDGIPNHLNLKTEPFIRIGNSYYYIETSAQKNWFDASESCHRIGAHLIAFETIEEWDLINQYLFENKIQNVYWTSGSDLAHQGKHIWFSIGTPIALNIWYPGEPNNVNGNEHCDEMGYQERLNDLSCEKTRRYICERAYPKTASFFIW